MQIRMIKDRGIDALVNECLIGPVLSMGSTFIAYACALLAYLYLVFTAPAYNSNGDYTPVVVAFAFFDRLASCEHIHDTFEQRHRHDFSSPWHGILKCKAN